MQLNPISVFSVSACDSKSTNNKSEASKIENSLAGHVEALEKAKNIEKQLLEAQQKTKDAIEKATQKSIKN